MKVQRADARAAEDLDGAFAAIRKTGADALVVFPDPILYRERWRIGELATKSRLPAMFGHRGFVDAGGLMSYAPSYPDLGRRAANWNLSREPERTFLTPDTQSHSVGRVAALSLQVKLRRDQRPRNLIDRLKFFDLSLAPCPQRSKLPC